MATNPKIVMISSTARDLPIHRQEVLAACLKQEFFPKMMEHLPASDDEAISASLKMVDEADIYLGIFANRYGYVPAGHEISVTEMEYNRAVERKIPRLIFMMDASHSVVAEDVETGEGAQKLQAFKNRVQPERVGNFFKSPADLSADVINSLSKLRDFASQKQNLIQEARRMERTTAYIEAIEVWEKIVQLDPADVSVANEIKRLHARLALAAHLNEYIKQLTKRIAELGAHFKVVIEFLKQTTLDPDDPQLDIIDSFLKQDLSAEEFKDAWQVLAANPIEKAKDQPNYRALADRIKRGEIVLFLGPEVSSLYAAPNQSSIVNTLAQQADYPDFTGSLAALSEYYHIQTDYGRQSLLSNLHQLVQTKQVAIPLFQKIARIEQPLVLISAAYDTSLEDAFQQAGKKYALLSSVIHSSMDHEIGSILLQYSDGRAPDKFSPKEQLSGLDLIKNCYSLIYEVRGFLDSIEAESCNRGCHAGALAISESNYFNFARYVDKLIPDYLIRQFAGRGLFFLGFAPRQWDDRLIIDAILDKRHQHRQIEPPSSISSADDDKFQKAYWESRGVRRYEMELQDFFNQLEAHL